MACVATLPAFFFVVYLAASDRNSELRQAESEARYTAELASREHAHQIAGVRRLLERLAALPVEDVREMLPAILSGFPQVANIGILDLRGNVVYSVVPTSRPIGMSESSAFAGALRSDEVTIGQYQVGKIVGRPVLLMAKATARREAVLFAALELSWLGELARQADVPPETILVIADRTGSVLAASADHANGQRLESFYELITRKDGMVAVGDRLAVAVPLRGFAGLWVVVGAPEAKIRSIGNRVFYRDLTVLALFAVFAIAASVYAADVTERRDREATRSRDTLRALTHRLQTVREDEAQRIAQELHDELGQQLTALKLEVERVRRRAEAGRDTAEPLEDMSEMIDEAIHAVRRISSELRPGVLDRLGLTAALEWLLREFERRSSIRTELHAQDVGPADSDTATTLFRITQEGLTNVARHSRATSVVAELTATAGSLVLRIRDDGTGFDAAVAGRTSLGLLGMKDRAARLGGTLVIISAPGRGTELVATVPKRVPDVVPEEEPACLAS